MHYSQQQADHYSKKYEQAEHLAQMEIFQLKNDNFDRRDEVIDLHGLHVGEALNILSIRLNQIKVDLDKGEIIPNMQDEINHVLKIVCGRGSHSNGRPVLKYRVPQFLVSNEILIM